MRINKIKRILLFDCIPLDILSTNKFIKILSTWIENNEKKAIFYLNTHNIVQSLQNQSYLSALQAADIIYPDGWGPVITAQLSGIQYPERVNAADFIDKVFQNLNKQKNKIYLLGSEEKILKKSVKNISRKYRNIVIAGYYHGFFTEYQEKKIISDIKTKRPDLTLIGMGTPKQELWVRKNWKYLPNGVYWTVGGLYHYISGRQSRAPSWLRNNGLEWLYRLLLEPRRLWKRYIIGNMIFLYLLSTYFVKKRFINI